MSACTASTSTRVRSSSTSKASWKLVPHNGFTRSPATARQPPERSSISASRDGAVGRSRSVVGPVALATRRCSSSARRTTRARRRRARRRSSARARAPRGRAAGAPGWRPTARRARATRASSVSSGQLERRERGGGHDRAARECRAMIAGREARRRAAAGDQRADRQPAAERLRDGHHVRHHPVCS